MTDVTPPEFPPEPLVGAPPVASFPETSADLDGWLRDIEKMVNDYFKIYFPNLRYELFNPTTAGDKTASIMQITSYITQKPELLTLETTVAERIKFETLHFAAPNYLQVEPMLRKAGNLLDRCMADRSIWQQLNVERFKTAMELINFILSDWITQTQEAAEMHQQDLSDAVASRDAETIAIIRVS